MKMIPCKHCKTCGLYHGIYVSQCACGADLSRVPGIPVDRDILEENRGDLDFDRPVYVQKCSCCGTENFTDDPNNMATRCHHCNRSRIRDIAPVLYAEEKEAPPQEPPARIAPLVTGSPEPEDDEDEDDAAASYMAILSGIPRPPADASADTREPAIPPRPSAPEEGEEDEDDDDEEAALWANLAGLKGAPLDIPRKKTASGTKPPAPAVSTLTLTAIRFGSYTFTLRSDSSQLPFLLGRSAGCAEFLQQDGYVSNLHCCLDFRGGSWYVRNNHARNGTRVNDRDLSPEGEQILRSGDVLTLGHNPASMAFRVTLS